MIFAFRLLGLSVLFYWSYSFNEYTGICIFQLFYKVNINSRYNDQELVTILPYPPSIKNN